MDGTPETLEATARGLALEAGALLRHRYARDLSIATKSSVTDMVTDVDRQSERLIVSRLAEMRPHDGILGEEGASREGTSGTHWIVDPLDGTTNYIYGYPAFSVSIAAEVDAEVVAAAVYDPLHQEMFSARIDGRATLNGALIHVSEERSLATALLATGFGYDPARRAFQGRVLADIVPRIRDVRRGGSAALDLCWVACGRVDAYYEFGLNIWDLAAGALIVRQAGGRTSTYRGVPEGINSIVAGGPEIFEPLRSIVEETHVRFSDLRA